MLIGLKTNLCQIFWDFQSFYFPVTQQKNPKTAVFPNCINLDLIEDMFRTKNTARGLVPFWWHLFLCLWRFNSSFWFSRHIRYRRICPQINIYCHVQDWHFPPNFDFAWRFYISLGMPSLSQIDWYCFYYSVRKCPVALLEALCARIRVCSDIFSPIFMCVQDLCLWEKTCLLPLSTRLLCLVVAIPLVCWLYMCACVCVPLCVHVKMCN